MLPVRQDLVLYRGDSTDIAIRLFARGPDGAADQLIPGQGEVFRLAILSPEMGSLFNWSTAGAGDAGLLLEVGDDETVLRRRLRAQDTAGLPLGLTWEFVRIPGPGQRRTYVTGAVTVVGPGQPAPGDPTLNLAIGLGGTALDVTVIDGTGAASGLIAEAVAALRGGAPSSETIKTLRDRIATLAAGVSDAATAAELSQAVQSLTAVLAQKADSDSLGDAAGLDVGATSGTVAAGDDERITNAVQKDTNGAARIAEGGTGGKTATEARANLGLAALATKDKAANADLADAPGATLKGRDASGIGAPQDLTFAAVAGLLGLGLVLPALTDGTGDQADALNAWLGAAGPKFVPKATGSIRVTKNVFGVTDKPADIDFRNNEIVLDFSDGSGSPPHRIVVPEGSTWRNLRIRIPAGRVICRPLYVVGEVENVHVYSEDLQPSGARDGGLCAFAGSPVIKDCSVSGYNIAANIKGTTDLKLRNFHSDRWIKGILTEDNIAPEIENPTFGPLSTNGAYGDPGLNCIPFALGNKGGSVKHLRAPYGAKEHIFYFGDDADVAGSAWSGWQIHDVIAEKPGQCGFKARGVSFGKIFGYHVIDCGWGGLTGNNDDAQRWDRAIDCVAEDFSCMRKDKDEACHVGIWINGCERLRLSLNVDVTASHGIQIVDENGRQTKDITIVLKGRKVIGDLVNVSCSTYAPEGIDITAEVDQVQGALVKWAAPANTTPLRIRGRFKTLYGPRIVNVNGLGRIQDDMVRDGEDTRSILRGVFEDETRKWLVRQPVTPKWRYNRAMDDLAILLRSLGWASIDDFWLLNTASREGALIGLKGLDVASLGASASVGFAAGSGFTGDRTGSLTTPIIPSSGTTALKATDFLVGIVIADNVAADQSPDFGTNSGVSANAQLSLRTRTAGDQLTYRANGPAHSISSADSRGHYQLARNGNAVTLYRDGVQIASTTETSATLMGGALSILRDGGQFSGRTVRAFYAMAYRPPADQVAIHTALTPVLAATP